MLPEPYRRVYTLIALLCLVAATVGCEKSADGEEGTEKATASASEKTGSSESPESKDPSDGEATLFDDDTKWKPCDVLDAALVSDTFGVPADEVETPSSGSFLCLHIWESKNESRQLTAEMGRIQVSSKLSRARQWFANTTKNRSKKEMQKQMDNIKKRAREKLDEDGKSETEKEASDSVADALGIGAQAFEKVDGIGDEAAVNTGDANVYVRLGNMIFRVSAYHGATKEEPRTTDIEAIKKAHADFQTKTYDQRRKQSIQLARAVVKKLETMR